MTDSYNVVRNVLSLSWAVSVADPQLKRCSYSYIRCVANFTQFLNFIP